MFFAWWILNPPTPPTRSCLIKFETDPPTPPTRTWSSAALCDVSRQIQTPCETPSSGGCGGIQNNFFIEPHLVGGVGGLNPEMPPWTSPSSTSSNRQGWRKGLYKKHKVTINYSENNIMEYYKSHLMTQITTNWWMAVQKYNSPLLYNGGILLFNISIFSKTYQCLMCSPCCWRSIFIRSGRHLDSLHKQSL